MKKRASNEYDKSYFKTISRKQFGQERHKKDSLPLMKITIERKKRTIELGVFNINEVQAFFKNDPTHPDYSKVMDLFEGAERSHASSKNQWTGIGISQADLMGWMKKIGRDNSVFYFMNNMKKTKG